MKNIDPGGECPASGVDLDEIEARTLHRHLAEVCEGLDDTSTVDRLLYAYNYGDYRECPSG